jgi:hypothetical protein
MTEKVCPNHGPFPAGEASCPYCLAEAGGGRPAAPAPLEDDMVTDLGEGGGYGYDDDDAPTELSPGRHAPGYSDPDDDEETDLGRLYDDDITILDDVEAGTMGLLWVKEGHRAGRVVKLKETTVIGRNEGDLILDDPKVSNNHAKIKLEDEVFVIQDFLSKNGTFVNGEKISAVTELKENDTIKIGDTLFVLKTLL